MMSVADELQTTVNNILTAQWDIREGRVVPTTDDVLLAGGGVEMDATVLYADLAESSRLASEFDRRTAAKVVKAFLACATRLITHRGGTVASFDGDRVMGIFVGNSKNTSATKCALHINYAVTKIIRPALAARFQSLQKESFVISHCTGVDTSRVLVVRAGQRGSNDLIWIGRAPNLAARLSELRVGNFGSYISADVFNAAHRDAKYDGTPEQLMWESRSLTNWRGGDFPIYRSSWWRRP